MVSVSPEDAIVNFVGGGEAGSCHYGDQLAGHASDFIGDSIFSALEKGGEDMAAHAHSLPRASALNTSIPLSIPQSA